MHSSRQSLQILRFPTVWEIQQSIEVICMPLPPEFIQEVWWIFSCPNTSASMLSHTHYIFCMLFKGNNTCPEHLFSLDITDFLINLHDLTTVNYLTTQNTTELVCICVCVCAYQTHINNSCLVLGQSWLLPAWLLRLHNVISLWTAHSSLSLHYSVGYDLCIRQILP